MTPSQREGSARAVGRGLTLNHSRAVSRALTLNHSRALASI
jgi:hypothetical protein